MPSNGGGRISANKGKGRVHATGLGGANPCRSDQPEKRGRGWKKCGRPKQGRPRQKTKIKRVYVVPVGADKISSADQRCSVKFGKIQKLEEYLREETAEEVKALLGCVADLGKTRKKVEFAFKNVGQKYCSCVTRGRFKAIQRPARSTDILAVKAGGKSYAELVMTLKEEIDIQEVGATVRRLRKTAKGDLQVVVEGGEEKAILLESRVKRKLDGWEVVRGREG